MAEKKAQMAEAGDTSRYGVNRVTQRRRLDRSGRRWVASVSSSPLLEHSGRRVSYGLAEGSREGELERLFAA